MLLWTPVVIAAAGFTVTVWLAPFGIPALLLALPPMLACNERRCGRRPARGLVAVGVITVAALDAGALVLAVDAGLGASVYAGSVALSAWSAVATVVLVRLRSVPLRAGAAEPEALGLWLQVIWLPMVVAMLLPAALVFGAPFLLLALANCYAGWLRHRLRPVPVRLMVTSSLAVATWTVPPVVVAFAQDGLLLDLLTLAALLPWIVPAILTNALLWASPTYRLAPPPPTRRVDGGRAGTT